MLWECLRGKTASHVWEDVKFSPNLIKFGLSSAALQKEIESGSTFFVGYHPSSIPSRIQSYVWVDRDNDKIIILGGRYTESILVMEPIFFRELFSRLLGMYIDAKTVWGMNFSGKLQFLGSRFSGFQYIKPNLDRRFSLESDDSIPMEWINKQKLRSSYIFLEDEHQTDEYPFSQPRPDLEPLYFPS